MIFNAISMLQAKNRSSTVFFCFCNARKPSASGISKNLPVVIPPLPGEGGMEGESRGRGGKTELRQYVERR